MITVSYATFMYLVRQRRRCRYQPAQSRERVLRPDQEIIKRQTRRRCLATCRSCDFVVDASLLDPDTKLCPRCQREQGRSGKD